MMILVIDSNRVFGGCVMRTLKKIGFGVKLFDNAIDAMQPISDGEVPEMIFMDVILKGPDGFTFLNELASYIDTFNIPVVIVSEKDFSKFKLLHYGVVGALDKNTMRPEEVEDYAKKYT